MKSNNFCSIKVNIYKSPVSSTRPSLSWASHRAREVAWESLALEDGQNRFCIFDSSLITCLTSGKSLSLSECLFGQRFNVTDK